MKVHLLLNNHLRTGLATDASRIIPTTHLRLRARLIGSEGLIGDTGARVAPGRLRDLALEHRQPGWPFFAGDGRHDEAVAFGRRRSVLALYSNLRSANHRRLVHGTIVGGEACEKRSETRYRCCHETVEDFDLSEDCRESSVQRRICGMLKMPDGDQTKDYNCNDTFHKSVSLNALGTNMTERKKF